MPIPTNAAKKQPITLAQLSSYDDILTDVLIDHAYYWTTIPKNRPSYRPSRGVTEEEVAKIIQSHLIVDSDLETAESKLLATDGLRRFYSALKTPKEKDDFCAHLRRYMRIYLPDCPFEVSSTNRYTIYSHEAAITARKYIKKGQAIKYLSGIQVMITAKEDKELAKRKKDFSIVISSRNKCAALFMGPARFANHDCEANARLMITGQAGIEIVATRPIDVGDEITVSYAENYFGEDNCECLCKTCEDKVINGWAQGSECVALKRSIEDANAEGYSLRRRRRDDSCASGSRTPSVTPDIRPRIRKTKPKTQSSSSERESLCDSPAPQNILREKRKREYESLRSPPVTPAKRLKTLQYEVEPVPLLGGLDSQSSESSDDTTPSEHSASDSASTGATIMTDATTPEEEIPEAAIRSPTLTPTRPRATTTNEEDDALFTSADFSRTLSLPPANTELIPQLSELSATKTASLDSTESLLAGSLVDEHSPASLIGLSAQSNSVSEKVPLNSHECAGAPDESSTRGRQRGRRSSKAVEEQMVVETPDEPVEATKKRVPGDYTLTPVLLSEPNTAWIHCTICGVAFVQKNAYYTRSSCFRCERHSKLYGYSWPKTEKEGPNDKEERVLDHRTIHRFLDTEEEARVRGRKIPAAFAARKLAAQSTSTPVGKRGPGRPRKHPAGPQIDVDVAQDSEDDGSIDVRRTSRQRKLSLKAVVC